MPGQTVEREQANPIIHGIQRICFASRKQIILERRDLPECVRMKKNEQLFGKLRRRAEIDLMKPFSHFLEIRRTKAWTGQNSAQWIDIVAEGNPAQ